MVGPRLTVLRGWSDCERCPRHGHRLGVVARDWGRRPRVLVLELRAHRMTQGLVASSPRAEAFAFELAHEVGLASDDVVVDVLLACGLGHEAAADHVAACSARFVENTQKYGRPEVVVVVGAHARAAVEGAGLTSGQHWAPVGITRSPALYAPTWAVAGPLVRDIKQLLFLRAPRGRRTPAQNLPLARRLIDVLGPAEGSASKGRAAENWTRRKKSPLTAELVDGHLRGKRFAAPFRPYDPWPFVVVDADRHDALQEAHFADTFKKLERHFPRSLFIESSTSGGLHVYVKLPPNVQYHEGATWLEAYFALHKLLILEKNVVRAGRPAAVLRSARLEVPRQPVRLPFGRGSHVATTKGHPGSHPGDTATTKVNTFIDWLKTSPTTDFAHAQKFVAMQLKITTAWSVEKKKLLERRIEEAHVAGRKPVQLTTDDPWSNVVPKFRATDRALRVIATAGVPAMGTRTRWTERLVDELFDLVSPDQVEALMIHWLEARDHNSEDIEVDLPGVEAALRNKIEAKTKSVQGVPVRVWVAVQKYIERGWSILSTSRKPGWALASYQARWYLSDDAQRELRNRESDVCTTAFYILRRFFDQRVPRTEGVNGERPIARREFSAFMPNEMRAAVKEFFLLSGWLKISGEYEKGKAARKYQLADELWPMLPGEDVVFVPGP